MATCELKGLRDVTDTAEKAALHGSIQTGQVCRLHCCHPANTSNSQLICSVIALRRTLRLVKALRAELGQGMQGVQGSAQSAWCRV